MTTYMYTGGYFFGSTSGRVNLLQCNYTELSLVTISTGVSGHSRSSKWYHSIDCVSYYCHTVTFPKTCCFWDSRLRIMPYFKNTDRGHLRSVKINPFDMPSIITYCRSLAAMGLSLVVFDILDHENTATLKSGSEITHRNWYNSIDWLWFPISVL